MYGIVFAAKPISSGLKTSEGVVSVRARTIRSEVTRGYYVRNQ